MEKLGVAVREPNLGNGKPRAKGADGSCYIAEQIGRIVLEDDADGVAMWKEVAAI